MEPDPVSTGVGKTSIGSAIQRREAALSNGAEGGFSCNRHWSEPMHCMPWRRQALPLFLICLPIVLFLCAGASLPVIKGVVLGDDEHPLDGAAIQLYEEFTGRERYVTVSREDGSFAFEDVPPGSYRLVVTHLGYASRTEQVVVLPAGTIDVRVVLASLAVETEEVVVLASRARQLTPITFTNLTAREISLQSSMRDLPVHLASLPSITHYSENGVDMGYTHLRMRGFDQRRVAVSINGMPQNDPEEHNVYWINFFDLQGAIEDIQVQRGAGASFYGSPGIGGAINIIATPYKASPYATAEVGYGTYNTQRYTVEANSGLLGGRTIAFGRFSRLLSDGYRDWSWSQFWRFFGGLTHYGDGHTVTVQAYGGPQRDGLAYSGIAKSANTGSDADRTFNFSGATRDQEYFHQPHVELLHDWQVTPSFTVRQAIFWLQGVGHFDFGGTFRSADYLRLPNAWRDLSADERAQPLYLSAPDVSILFRAALDQWHSGWMPRATLMHDSGETTIGAEARLHRSLRWGRIQEATGVPAGLVGSDNDVRVYSFRGEKIVTSLYGSHLQYLGNLLAVQADLQVSWRRYRIYDEAFFGNAFEKPYLFVNPRIGVTYNPEQPFSAYASIALANREPRMKSLYDGEEAGAGFQPQFATTSTGAYDYGSPVVKPEQLLDVEVGARIKHLRYRAAANVFWMDFRNEIVPSGGLDQFGVPRTGNAGRTRHLGIEVEAAARLLAGLDVYVNATVSQNKFVRFQEFVTLPDYSTQQADRAGNPIAGFPSQVANLGLTYTIKGLTARVSTMFAGRQYIDNGGGRDALGIPSSDLEVDPYTLVNASIRYAFPSRVGLELSLDVNNVLNDRVLLFGNAGFGTPQFFPAATRHMFFSARYTISR